MRPLLLGLLGLLLLLQYRLWLGEGGIRERQGLEAQVRAVSYTHLTLPTK